MAFVVNDRVKETTTSTGTGTINLAGAETGFETFVAGIGNSNTTYYCIQAQGGSAFEIGVGTVTDASPDTLSRTAIISSSNGDAAVDFGAGTKDVFCTLPASKAVIEDNSTNANIAGNLTLGGTVDGVDIAARDAVLTSTTTTANAALPKAGGTMSGNLVLSGANITMSGSETVDGVDVSARDSVLTSTTTTANAALPKAGSTMTGDLILGDNIKVEIGDATGGDLQLFHDTNNSIIKSTTGELQILSDNLRLKNNANDETLAEFTNGSSNKFYFNNILTAQTASNAFQIPADNIKLEIGDGQDLKIYHDTSDSYISEEGTGKLIIRGSTAVRITNVGGDNMFVGNDGGAAELYHAGTKKLETTSSGVTVSGSINGDPITPQTSTTSAASSDEMIILNGSGNVRKITIANAALQGPAGSPGSNGSPGPPGPSGTITNTSYQMTALGVGTAAGPTGQIRATSNITAYYSDSRLKDFEGPIDSALDKVKALTGYYFKENDLARSFGYDNEKRQVGVSAQEVESVLPEVVTEAPFNSDYKSVWYEKLVPLLIEAIKELDDKKKDK